MPGLNSSLNIALSGLQANQSALSTIGHNIANVNTPNYSRQRVSLSSNGAQPFGNLEYGTGVNLASISGVRDRFLDMQVIQASCRKFGADVRFNGVEGISSMFLEIESDESAMGTLTRRFFQSFQELSSRPEDLAVRNNVLGRAKSMVDGIQSRYQLLADQRLQADRAVGSLVQEVNNLTGEIAKLNGRISTELTPGGESDARDQRMTLATKLGNLIGIQVFEDSQGQLQVMVDGGSAVLVNGSNSLSLRTAADTVNLGGMLRVEAISASGAATDITRSIQEGSLGANLDLRDNILPGFQRNLDQFAAGVASQVNQVHRTGYNLQNAATGLDFFLGSAPNGANGLPSTVDPAQNYKGMVYALSINPALVNNNKLIASSDAPNAPGNNKIALALSALQTKGNSVDTNGDGAGDTGPFSNYVASISNQIGTIAQGLESRSNNDENLLVALQSQRDRVSGVDLDEEATQMMTFQRGYQASARFVSVINELTDQLVNQFGR